MSEPTIIYFPVENADTSLIRLGDGTSIMIDCQFRDDSHFDIPVYLQTNLKKLDGILHLDVFVLTHPHKDHILGIEKAFYLGDPKDFSDKDKKQGKIIIDELWFAPRIFANIDELCEDAEKFKNETERRIKIYRSGKAARDDAGNRLGIIGATVNDDFDDLKDITTYPGEIIDRINDVPQKDFRFFVFAPVKRDSDDDSIGPNNTSIVLQARFDVDDVEDVVRAFFGGDAEYPVWERIIEKNKDNEENLEWDLLLTPHHCSWTFFNSTDEDEPLETSLRVLNLKRTGAYVVASSKSIKDNNDNPPSYKAKQLYVKAVGVKKFLCTGEYPDEDEPKPIQFTMSSKGLTSGELSESNKRFAEVAVGKALSEPRRYG